MGERQMACRVLRGSYSEWGLVLSFWCGFCPFFGLILSHFAAPFVINGLAKTEEAPTLRFYRFYMPHVAKSLILDFCAVREGNERYGSGVCPPFRIF